MKNKEYFKIKNLYSLNILNEKCKILLNNSNKLTDINLEFYDFYFLNNLDWLIENQDKINNDFNNNINKMKFDIVYSNLDERVNIILNIKDLDEFAEYISSKSDFDLQIKFNKFANIKDDYLKLKYFDRIKR